jgi:hypothetical protein
MSDRKAQASARKLAERLLAIEELPEHERSLARHKLLYCSIPDLGHVGTRLPIFLRTGSHFARVASAVVAGNVPVEPALLGHFVREAALRALYSWEDVDPTHSWCDVPQLLPLITGMNAYYLTLRGILLRSGFIEEPVVMPDDTFRNRLTFPQGRADHIPIRESIFPNDPGALAGAINLLVEPAEALLPPPDWITGSRRKLNKALGYSEGYSDAIEREGERGDLVYRQDGQKISIHIADPNRHLRVKREMADKRK